jgi:hypothetical protein
MLLIFFLIFKIFTCGMSFIGFLKLFSPSRFQI